MSAETVVGADINDLGATRPTGTAMDILPVETILAGAIPAQPVKTGIYFLIKDNKVIYVGQSRNITCRLAGHAQSKTFDSWYWIPCEVERLNEVERVYIRTLLPVENMDSTSRKLRAISRRPRAKKDPAKLPDPVQIPAPGTAQKPSANVRSRDLIEALDIDRPARQAEWMRRLRAVKADKSLRIDGDFGPDPFSLEWTAPG
jgi:hypothetical protein